MKRQKKQIEIVPLGEILYRFIFDDYVQHTIMVSACEAIARKRSRQSFPKELAVKVFYPVVTNAKYWYNKTVEKLPPLDQKTKETVAKNIYDSERRRIEKLVNYYKKLKE